MGYYLLIQALLDSWKESVKLFWANHWPWDNAKFAMVEFCDEICILFILHNFLEFQWKPFNNIRILQDIMMVILLSDNILSVSIHNILEKPISVSSN